MLHSLLSRREAEERRRAADRAAQERSGRASARMGNRVFPLRCAREAGALERRAWRWLD